MVMTRLVDPLIAVAVQRRAVAWSAPLALAPDAATRWVFVA
jgi:hypothetical protein